MTMTAELRTTVVRTVPALEALIPGWRAALARYARPTIFDTPDWLLPAASLLDSEPLAVALSTGDELRGLLPLASSRQRGLRVIRGLGSGGGDYSISDYLGAVVACGEERTLAAATVEVLRREPWDAIDLQELPAGSPLADAIVAEVRRTNWHVAVEASGHSHRLPLPQSWSSYVADLSRNMREVLERKDRKLEREHRVEYRRVTEPGDLAGAMQRLFDLHTVRWQQRGQAGIFRSPRLRRFHLEVARRALEQGTLDLALLVVDGLSVAVDYGFRIGDTHFFYAAGFDPDPAWARYSIGAVLRGRSIRRAIADGLRTYDFLRGDRAYKQRYGTQEVAHVRLRIFRSATLYQGWRAARFAKRAARSLQQLRGYAQHDNEK